VKNWVTLRSLISNFGFPAGTMIGGAHTWSEVEVEEWLARQPASRPTNLHGVAADDYDGPRGRKVVQAQAPLTQPAMAGATLPPKRGRGRPRKIRGDSSSAGTDSR
jgi:hypothetical protein